MGACHARVFCSFGERRCPGPGSPELAASPGTSELVLAGSAWAQVAFGARLGTIFTDHPAYLPTLEGHREIVVLDGQGGGRANLWHSDVSISPKPPMG